MKEGLVEDHANPDQPKSWGTSAPRRGNQTEVASALSGDAYTKLTNEEGLAKLSLGVRPTQPQSDLGRWNGIGRGRAQFITKLMNEEGSAGEGRK